MKKLLTLLLCTFAVSTWAYDYTPVHSVNLPFENDSGFIDNDNYLFDIMMDIADHSSIYDVGPADIDTYVGTYIPLHNAGLPFENGSELTTNDQFLYDKIIESQITKTKPTPDENLPGPETSIAWGYSYPTTISIDENGVWSRKLYYVGSQTIKYSGRKHGVQYYLYIGEAVMECHDGYVAVNCEQVYPLGINSKGFPNWP